MKGALYYNEQKVQQGNAECILANRFPRETHALSFRQKLLRFEDLHALNLRTKTNTLHISLNFSPREKLDKGRLSEIATTYMDKIGFGDQPYLIYEHRDAGHPHIHILTTLIQENGKRIPIHNLGKNQSEQARQQIEKEFHLLPASKKERSINEEIWAGELTKVQYGKVETKRSVSNIVRVVTRSYKYTSFPELNAILGLYNVRAEQGSEGSKLFERKGLLYTIIDRKGTAIGVPIKASAIYGKPTKVFLERQFKLNELLRKPFRTALRESISRGLYDSKSRPEFIQAMARQNILVLFRSNADGRTYGLTFIDKNTKCVFNGSALGKEYSANAILNRLANGASNRTIMSSPKNPVSIETEKNTSRYSVSEIFKALTVPEPGDKLVPEAILKLSRRRRKKKKGHSL